MGFKDKKFAKPSKATSHVPSQHLYLGGIGSQMKTPREELRILLAQFGELLSEEEGDDGITMPEDRRFCFASFSTIDAAERAHHYFSTEASFPTINASKVDVKYAQRVDDEQKKSPEPECTSLSEHIVVPGLAVINNFISLEEEQALMNELANKSSPAWKESLSRRVQHYGFPFNYRTLMVDYAKPTPPLPVSCVSLSEKIAEAYQQSIQSGELPADSPPFQPLNQLTINEYWPGQGIASHIDTETCFGPVFFILNLENDIVMTLTKSEGLSAASVTQDIDENTEKNEENETSSHPNRVRKYVLLPARSLLVISGDARYRWAHGITPRKFDKVQGCLLPRQRRVSFTFRHVVPPGPIPSSRLTSGDIETEHVVKVYDAIAVHWNHTRGKRKVHWHRVKEFLESLPSGSLVGDVGSGDGKYFNVRPDLCTIGCDRSLQLLHVSKEVTHETFACDACFLPLQSHAFDAVLCIAVLHHIATVDRRCALIRELLRIAKDYAYVFIQAWALEQDTSKSKHVFLSQDTMVPWKLNKRFVHNNNSNNSNKANDTKRTPPTSETPCVTVEESPKEGKDPEVVIEEGKEEEKEIKMRQGKRDKKAKRKEKDSAVAAAAGKDALGGGEDEVVVYERYCHVYKEGELEDLCSQIAGCRIVDSGWDTGNWFVQLQKIPDTRLDHSEHGPESKVPYRPLHKL